MSAGAKVLTAYSGSRVLVTDQAGKQKISETNALGQLTDVWEVCSADSGSGTVSVSFPGHSEVTAGYQSSYAYDTLSNLVTVSQGGQSRTFAYDSLARLTRKTYAFDRFGIRSFEPHQCDSLGFTDQQPAKLAAE